ncbi:hypothetical protein [Dickeya sp. NCPPB 3274]|uniref:hypothetical protein n=1 Tax=Dickeya sp. NCPPB 3274 TaxID=568766 RepID=UPI001269237C|nr:hypothetical protein [Dickeya sp. NCPPB 3274]
MNMKYGKWFFPFAVVGVLFANMVHAEVQTADRTKSIFKKYQSGKTETGVYNMSGYCVALYRPDGKNINNAHYFEIGNNHFNQLPADHPEKLNIIFVPVSSSDTKTSCGSSSVEDPSNKKRKNVHFNLTFVNLNPPG